MRGMGGLRGIGQRLIAIADDPADDDDLRLRKRVGVAAGLLTIFAPLSLPIQAQGHPASFVLAASLSLFSVANLVALSRTRQFDRYVVALITAGTVWVPLAHIVGGGVTGTSPAWCGHSWSPRTRSWRSGREGPLPWFVAFVVNIVLMALLDPWARATLERGHTRCACSDGR